MNYSEDSESTKHIEYVENDDKSIHLILFEVDIGISYHFNVLLGAIAVVIILKDRGDVMIISLLGESELADEADYNHQIGKDRASF